MAVFMVFGVFICSFLDTCSFGTSIVNTEPFGWFASNVILPPKDLMFSFAIESPIPKPSYFLDNSFSS